MDSFKQLEARSHFLVVVSPPDFSFSIFVEAEDMDIELKSVLLVETTDVDIDSLDGTCGWGYPGNGICEDKTLCCSSYGWCSTSDAHCNNLAPVATCGGGSIGNGVCPNPAECWYVRRNSDAGVGFRLYLFRSNPVANFFFQPFCYSSNPQFTMGPLRNHNRALRNPTHRSSSTNVTHRCSGTSDTTTRECSASGHLRLGKHRKWILCGQFSLLVRRTNDAWLVCIFLCSVQTPGLTCFLFFGYSSNPQFRIWMVWIVS
jgi:hypothetical protein